MRSHVFVSRSPLVVALAAAFSLPTVWAGSTELAPVVVTATRSPMSMLNRLNDVSVIDSDAIAQSGQSSLVELLQQQHGLEISSNGGPQTASAVFIRGANSQQTLVLIDGQRFGSATLGGASLNAIPLGHVERIEILRGPASSLYGADAIGGVVNIITRKGDGPFKFNASAGYGSWDTFNLATGFSGKQAGLSYSLQLQHEKSDGYNAIQDVTNWSYNPDKDGYKRNSITGGLAYDWAAGHTLAFQVLHSDLNAQYDGGAGYDDKERLKASSLAVSSSDQLTEQWSSRLRLGQTIDNSKTDSSYPAHFKTRQEQFSWQNDFALDAANNLSIAVENLKEKVLADSGFAVILEERSTRSLVGVYQLHLGDHRLQANLRHDDSSQYNGQTTGALQYGYQVLPTLRLAGSYGTGFRAPSFNDLYYPGYGQTTIRPEKSKNAEIGLYLNQGLFDASLVAYRNRVKDLIEAQEHCTTPGYPSWCANNVRNATLEGLSMSAKQTWDNTTANWSFDFQRPSDDDSGHLLARRAKKHASVGLSQKIEQWVVGAEWQGSGRRYEDPENTKPMGGYALVNLFASYQISPAWQVLARWNNVTNKDYELAKGYATPDSNVFVSVQFQP